MLKYYVNDYNKNSEIQDIHCLFCGTRVGPDDKGNLGDCEHIIFNGTSETWENPEISKEDLFKDFNVEEDEYFEHLEKKLDDSYLMVIGSSSPISGLDVYFLFRQ
jgi:hypothetical protein|tara:strand:+ start:2150 stop:2464 length:315 start_codon:yes stop_codon:yes gene_type:complete